MPESKQAYIEGAMENLSGFDEEVLVSILTLIGSLRRSQETLTRVRRALKTPSGTSVVTHARMIREELDEYREAFDEV